MNILRLLGFHQVEFTSRGEGGEIYDKYTYWEWGFRIPIPFTKRRVRLNNVKRT